jgi:hypothetical protein
MATPAALLRLPFDQYGRYQMVREALDAARPLIGPRLRVLDVGGFFCAPDGTPCLPAQMFLPADDVTVVDQVSPDAADHLPGYVQGDGRRLDWADQAFDVVISCDTLEHVPAADRPAFWRELLRVARYGVALAAPFASPEVVAAEELLLRYIQTELGIAQPQLHEHAAYGLPQRASTAALLDDLRLAYRSYPAGQVHAWLAMMLAKHYLAGRAADLALHYQLDAYYSRFLRPHERREPAYRYLWLVQHTHSPDWLSYADAALVPTVQQAEQPGLAGWHEVASLGLHLLHWRTADQTQQQLQHLSHTIVALQAAVDQRDARICDLEQRAHWYEAQAHAAQHELAAIKHGRVMRLLRLVQRGGKAGQ